MNTRLMIVIVAIMIAVVIVLQAMPKHYDATTGKLSIRKPKAPKRSTDAAEEIEAAAEPSLEAVTS